VDTHRSSSRLVAIPEEDLTFWASLAPYERRGSLGVSERLRAVCFETSDGEWVGSVPVYRGIELESLSDDDLLELLDQAIARG
jgi:hypothetical protein